MPTTSASPSTRLNLDIFDDDTESPLVLEARAKVFRNGRCLICNHLEGDHESYGDGTFTCDDDCDEDLVGGCHPGRL